MRIDFDEIYERVGCLFYAIASEKQQLTSMNLVKVRQIIDQQWKAASNGDVMRSQLLDYLKYGFHNAADNALKPAEAFYRFRLYFELHNLPFGKDLRAQILVTARSIFNEINGTGMHSDFINCLEDLFELNSPEKAIKQMIRK